jgi:hypothetical protein
VDDLDDLSGAEGVDTASSVVRPSAILTSLLDVVRIAGNLTAQRAILGGASADADCCRVVRDQGRAFYQATSAIAVSDGLELRLTGSHVVRLTAQCIGTFTSELVDDICHISGVRRSRGCLARDAVLADFEDWGCEDCRKACGHDGDERWSEGLHLKIIMGLASWRINGSN